MKRKELESIIQAAVDGTITAEEFDRLQDALRESPKARSFYRHSMRVEQALMESWTSQAVRRTEVVPEKEPVPRLRKPVLMTALAAAAAIVIVAGGLFWQRMPPPAPGGADTSLHDTGSLPVLSPEPPNTVKVELTPGSILSGGDRESVEVGKSVKLLIGIARFALPGGSEVILEGPAVLHIRESRLLILDEGKAVVTVSPDDSKAGLILRTPQANYRDLGTKFGVTSLPNKPDELVTFDGRVEAEARFAVQEKRIVEKGQAVTTTPIGRWSDIGFQEDGYFHELPSALPGVHFGFDGDQPLQVDGLHPAVKDMEVKTLGGGAPRIQNGVRGQAIRFERIEDTVETTWAGIDGDNARTIACWVKLEDQNDDYAPIVGWGTGALNRGRWNLVAASQPKTGKRVLRLTFGHYIFFSGSTKLDQGNWYHVAAVFRGRARDGEEMVELYVNGEREKLDSTFTRSPSDDAALNTKTQNTFSVPLVIGRGPYLNSDTFFHGALDELYIFPYPLKVDTIRAMAARKTGE